MFIWHLTVLCLSLTQYSFVYLKYPVCIAGCELHVLLTQTPFCVNPRFVACIGATKWLLTQYGFVLIKYPVCIDGSTLHALLTQNRFVSIPVL